MVRQIGWTTRAQFRFEQLLLVNEAAIQAAVLAFAERRGDEVHLRVAVRKERRRVPGHGQLGKLDVVPQGHAACPTISNRWCRTTRRLVAAWNRPEQTLDERLDELRLEVARHHQRSVVWHVVRVEELGYVFD